MSESAIDAARVTRPAFPTRGVVDRVAIDNGEVSIAGWIVALDGSPLDGLEPLWSGEPLANPRADVRQPSPDVAAMYPELPGAASCRFVLRADAPSRSSDVLVSLRPVSQGRSGQRLYHFVDPAVPLPPREYVEAVGGDFLLIAFEMLGHLMDVAGLRRDHRVLDVGCGVGRIAYGLAYHLSEGGSYDGFDVMKPLVEWATANVTSRRSHFRFRHVDVYSRMYNAGGHQQSHTFPFPYPDDSFDFIIATSVFTHLQRREARHYLEEMARVLAPGGRIAATMFLIDEESTDLVRRGRSSQSLEHRYKGVWLAEPNAPEAAVGYDDVELRRWVAESGLRIAAAFPGSWCGRQNTLSYQDFLVLERSLDGAAPKRKWWQR